MSKSNQKYYVPLLADLANKLEPFALPALRVIAGLIFIYHGHSKFLNVVSGDGLGGLASYIGSGGLPFTLVLAWLAMITEFFGGICLILGLFTRLWAFLGVGMMVLIIIFIKGFETISARQGGFEYELAIAVILIVVFILGSGNFALDNKLKKTF